MIWPFFFKLRVGFFKGKKKNPQEMVSFDQAQKVGFVVKNDDQKLNPEIQDLGKFLLAKGKKLEVICLFDKIVNTKYEIPFHSIHRKDFNIWGKPKDPVIQEFIEKKFDYLIFLVDNWYLELEPFLKENPSSITIGNPNIIPLEQLDLGLVQDSKGLKNYSSLIKETLTKI